MRKMCLLVVMLATTPLWAQDDAPSATFGGSGGAQVFTRVDAVNPMDQVKTFLSKANISLNADQEKVLRPAVEAAIKRLRDISDRTSAGRGRGAARTEGQESRRRGGESAGISALANGPAAQEIKTLNDDLMAKITEVLRPDRSEEHT